MFKLNSEIQHLSFKAFTLNFASRARVNSCICVFVWACLQVWSEDFKHSFALISIYSDFDSLLMNFSITTTTVVSNTSPVWNIVLLSELERGSVLDIKHMDCIFISARLINRLIG